MLEEETSKFLVPTSEVEKTVAEISAQKENNVSCIMGLMLNIVWAVFAKQP